MFIIVPKTKHGSNVHRRMGTLVDIQQKAIKTRFETENTHLQRGMKFLPSKIMGCLNKYPTSLLFVFFIYVSIKYFLLN